jgi:hypothetical protein
MRLRRDKTAHAVGRPSWGSSFLGDPDAKFLCGKRERDTKKEKSSKKERKEGLWKLTLLMEIRKERGFPQQLEKSLAKDARLFHSSHRPNNKDLSNNQLQAAVHLKKAKYWSEGWGAPHCWEMTEKIYEDDSELRGGRQRCGRK